VTEPPLLETELVPLHALHEHPENWNRGDDAAVADLLDRFGQWRPAVVQSSSGRVLIGNTMLRAAHRLGWSHLNVHYRDVDDDGARRILTADNRAHDLATTDERALVTLLAKLDGDLSGTLFELDDYDDLLAALQEADTSVPEVGAPYSSSGAYGPGGDAWGTNVHQSPSYAEYQDGYATRASRFLALIYPLAQYAWVVERLARIAAEEGCDNHSDALLRLIQNRTGETAPPADAPDPTPAALAAAEVPAAT
jgi:hypothetical protein